MKKISIFLLLIVAIITLISYIYLKYKANNNEIKRENLEFESYYNKEINGIDLATIINKAIDQNVINEVKKDDNGNYINNEINSINIDIKITDDNGKIYTMEKIFNGGTSRFVQYYNQIKFKCTNLEYHQKTNKIRYLLFEQISQ